jgi:hypothetical protein
MTSPALSPADRAAVVAELERSRDAFVAALTAVPPERWARRPAGGGWSGRRVRGARDQDRARDAPLPPGTIATTPAGPVRRGRARRARRRDLASLRDRTAHLEAPETVRPSGGRYASAEEAAADFAEARAAVLDFARTTAADLRAVFVPHPALRELDGYQWLLFIACHTDRHAAQLDALRAPDEG